jgi:hypothetical protein
LRTSSSLPVTGYSGYYPAFPEREVAAIANRFKEMVV